MKNKRTLRQKLLNINRKAALFVKHGAPVRWGLFIPLTVGGGEMEYKPTSEDALTYKNEIEISDSYSNDQKINRKKNASHAFYNKDRILNENKYSFKKMKGGLNK